jgi:hypothetical protein
MRDALARVTDGPLPATDSLLRAAAMLEAGAGELRFEVALQTRAFAIVAVGATAEPIAAGYLPDGEATAELLDSLGVAFAACLNSEAEARRAEVGARVNGQPQIAVLRRLAHVDALHLRIGAGRPPVWAGAMAFPAERQAMH